MMTEDRKPWEKQQGETAKQYAAFCAYRDLPAANRTLKNAWKVYRNKPDPGSVSSHFRGWSAKNAWVNRASAYDMHVDEQRRLNFQAQRLSEREKRQHVVRALETMLAKVMNTQNKDSLSPQELNTLANAASKVLNESRVEFDDLPTQRVASDTTLHGTMSYELVWGDDDADD